MPAASSVTFKEGGAGPPPLAPPNFALPPDFDPSRHELWSIRVPVAFDVAALDGVELRLRDDVKDTGVDGPPPLAEFELEGKHHALTAGHAAENESFRLLVRGGGDEADGNNSTMVPAPIPFGRHFNLVEAPPAMTETELAPSAERAPKVEGGPAVRLAYAPVEQARGLKRRWAIPGSRTEHTKTKEEREGGSSAARRGVVSAKRAKMTVKEAGPSTPTAQSSPVKEETGRMSKTSSKKKKKKEKKSKKLQK